MKARRGEGRRRAVAPRSAGRERRHLGVLTKLADQLRPLSVDCALRPTEEDDEGSRVAEVFVQHGGGAAGLGAADFDRARVEPALEAETENRQKRNHQRADNQRPTRMTQHYGRARRAIPLSARIIAPPPAPPHRHARSLAVGAAERGLRCRRLC